jgi:hypothetical protein
VEIEEAAPGHGGGAAGKSWGLTGLGRRRGLRRLSGRSRRTATETTGWLEVEGIVVGSSGSWTRGGLELCFLCLFSLVFFFCGGCWTYCQTSPLEN